MDVHEDKHGHCNSARKQFSHTIANKPELDHEQENRKSQIILDLENKQNKKRQQH